MTEPFPDYDVIQAECFPDPTQLENERETPQVISYPRRIRTVLAQRCLDADQRKMKAKWDRTKYHGTHAKRKWVSKRVIRREP